MVADAEAHRGEDARLRETIDARNELDSAAHAVQRRLDELGESVAVHDKARAEMLVGDARQALKEEAPLDRLRALTSELRQMAQSLSATTPPPGSADQSGGAGSSGDDDDVIDAEFSAG